MEPEQGHQNNELGKPQHTVPHSVKELPNDEGDAGTFDMDNPDLTAAG